MSSPSEMNSSVLDEEVFLRCCQLFLQLSDSLGDGWVWEQVEARNGFGQADACPRLIVDTPLVWGQVEGSAEGYMKKTTTRTVFMQSSPEGDPEIDRLTEEEDPGTDRRTEEEDPGTDRRTEEEDPGTDRRTEGDLKEQMCFSSSVSSDEAVDTRDDDEDDDDGVCVLAEPCSTVLQYEYHVLYSCSYSTPVLYFRVSTLGGRSLSLEEVWRSVHPSYRLRVQHSPLNTITQQEHPFLGQSFFVLHPCRTEEFMRPVMQAALLEQRRVNYVVTWLSIVGPVVALDVPLNYSLQSPPPETTPG